jgi:DNA-directed RNA polymerase specialized sigma24 family protein
MARLMGLTEDGVKMLLRRTRTALAKCVESKLAVHGAMARNRSDRD